MPPVFEIPLPRGRPLRLGSSAQVVGILNVTADSFSDGGDYLDPQCAFDAAQAMEAQGAIMIDIGACSTRPGARSVSAAEELERILPVVAALDGKIGIPLSIDTFRASIFRACWDRGAAVLNDITAVGHDDEMGPLLAATGAAVVLMHMQGDPQNMQQKPQYGDIVADLKSFFRKVLDRLRNFGVSWERTILDPGIGFGKTLAHNLEILRRIGEFQELDRPLLVGTSRKSFLGRILNRPEAKNRDHGTTATTVHLFQEGVQLIRVHDVAAAVDALKTIKSIKGQERA